MYVLFFQYLFFIYLGKKAACERGNLTWLRQERLNSWQGRNCRYILFYVNKQSLKSIQH